MYPPYNRQDNVAPPVARDLRVTSHSTLAPVAVLLSGGLDSAVLAGRMLADGRELHPLYIRGGLLWDRQEEAATESFLSALPARGRRPLTVLELPLGDLYGAHWSTNGVSTPAAGTLDEAVYLPGRNPLLLVKAAVYCQLHGVPELALATLSANPFGDATDEFFADFERAMSRALGAPLRITRPYGRLSKAEVIRLGRELPLERTFSCIHPRDGLHCGQCNKCAERREAFVAAGVLDATRYASSTSRNLQP